MNKIELTVYGIVTVAYIALIGYMMDTHSHFWFLALFLWHWEWDKKVKITKQFN